MANYSDQDLHWITVHPNGKGEKPGVKVAINGDGKVVKGPKGIKEDINKDGGLPEAESVPLAELNGGDENKGGGLSQFSKEQVDDVIKTFKGPYITEAAYKKVVETHPSLFFVGESGHVYPDNLDEVNALAQEYMKSGSGEGQGDLSIPTDEDLTFLDDVDGDLSVPTDEDLKLFEDDLDEGNVAEKKTSPSAFVIKWKEQHPLDYALYEAKLGKKTLEEKLNALTDEDFIETPSGAVAMKSTAHHTLLAGGDGSGKVESDKDVPEAHQDEPEEQGGVNGQYNGGNVPQAVLGGSQATSENWVTEDLTSGGYPFPKDEKELSSLTMVNKLGGHSGAEATLYKDASGNMFVMKRFSPSDKEGQQRIKEECDADAFYLAGGAKVPHFKLYGDEKSGYTKLSQYIPGTKTLGKVWGSADDALKEKIKEGLQKDFALDVMAGAWDVLGEGQDNILVDGDGNVWRCDNGCAFNRRAQGGEKSEAAWGNGHLDDLWTMRGRAAGLDGKKVSDKTGKASFFGDITTHQLLSDIVSRDWDKMIAHLPDATRNVMAKRIANAKEYHSVCDNVVTAGQYGDGKHAEDITLNYHCLNKFGAKVGCTNNDITPGNWGWCRGDGNGNPAPTLSDFFNTPEPKIQDYINLPEPDIYSFMPSSDEHYAENVLKTAGISLNNHLFVQKDGAPNKASVDAALALKPKLEALVQENGDGAMKAKEMLDYVGMIEALKNDGFKNQSQELPHSPSGTLDLNTEATNKAAKKQYALAHAEWENKLANGQQLLSQDHNEWEKKKSVAETKLAEATKKWQAESAAKQFKWKNLTACYEDFCKQNGIESSRFWELAKAQGGQSYSMGSCRMKVIEVLSMGGNLDHPTSSVNGIADYMSSVHYAAQEYKSHPGWLERDMKAYVAMKSLTQMILQNSSFTGNFKEKKCLRMCRTESKKGVVNKYNLQKGIPTIYPCGTHESFSVFKTYCYNGTETVLCDVPYSRISSLYFLRNPKGEGMYASDEENEAGVNAVGLPRVYLEETGVGLPIKDMWGDFDTAMSKQVVTVANATK